VPAAVAERPGMADYSVCYSALQVIDLDYPAAAAVGASSRPGVDWRARQTITARTPDGRVAH